MDKRDLTLLCFHIETNETAETEAAAAAAPPPENE